jgi:hypothetical protein
VTITVLDNRHLEDRCFFLRCYRNPYLRDVLDRISTHPNSRIQELLPDQWKKLRATAEATDPGG